MSAEKTVNAENETTPGTQEPPDWNEILTGFGLSDYALIGLMIGLVIAFYLFKRFVWNRISAEKDNFFILLFRNFNAPVQVLFLLTALYVTAVNLPVPLKEYGWVDNTYTIIIVALFGWIAMRAVHMGSDLFLRKFKIDSKNNLYARQMHTQVRVIRRLIGAMIVFLTIAVALMTFEEIRALGVSLLASAGVAGIVLGLAAQKTIGNFFTGLQIAITQPIRLGDAVVVEGEWGWIEEINLTYVVVKIWDWRRLVLPISYFVDNPFQNWTRATADLIGSVVLHLDYTTPMEPIRKELDRILENEAAHLWDGKVKVVQVIDTTDKTITIRALVSSEDSPTGWDLRCLVREKLIEFIQENYPGNLPRVRAELEDPLTGTE